MPIKQHMSCLCCSQLVELVLLPTACNLGTCRTPLLRDAAMSYLLIPRWVQTAVCGWGIVPPPVSSWLLVSHDLYGLLGLWQFWATRKDAVRAAGKGMHDCGRSKLLTGPGPKIVAGEQSRRLYANKSDTEQVTEVAVQKAVVHTLNNCRGTCRYISCTTMHPRQL